MIYEFIATVAAGFGMAGLALLIRQLTKLVGIQTPKWLIPIFAGLGMLGFQIHQEYNWQAQQIRILSEKVQVVKTIEDKVWYRPWSYIKPQVIRFMAVSEVHDLNIIDNAVGNDADENDANNDFNDDIKRTNIYLFERRISTKIIPQLINCSQHTTTSIAPDTASDTTVSVATLKQLKWSKIDADDALFKTVCQ